MSPPAHGYVFGPFRVDMAMQSLARDGRAVAVKPKAFELLLLLLRHRDRVLGKQELISSLWPERVVGESNLSQNVYELRCLLDDRQRPFRWIENVSRRGYRFVGDVTPIHAAPGAPAVTSLAVLPFRRLDTGESGPDEPLRFGIADTIITALASRSRRIAVRPISSVQAFGMRSIDPLAAARRLQVDAVLDGSVQRAGDRLRVSVRLIHVADGAVLWADRFDGTLDQLFAFQDTIAERLGDAIALHAEPDSAPVRKADEPVDTEAYLLFLRGRHHWHQWTPPSWTQAEACLKAAIERAPTHAPSHAWLAATYSVQGIFGVLPARDAFKHARVAVQRALALDPVLPEAHEFMGAIAFWHDWDWLEAHRWLGSAVRLNPGGSGGHHLLGLLYAHIGQAEASITSMREARRIDPLSLIVNTDVGWVLYFARRHEEALAEAQATLQLEPNFAHARLLHGLILQAVERYDEALARFREAGALSGRDADADPYIAGCLARSGDRTAAETILATLEKRTRETHVDPMWLARACAGLERRDAVFHWMEKALADHSRDLITLAVDPAWDPLRSDPRFDALQARLGLPASLEAPH
jgi:DNA-binding winged helix-turn-helix (wHTH) protein/tetratricopeptide (TPR) repeat protein